MGKKCKIPIFHFPLFKHKWAQNTLESGLNVMKYHCGLRKKDLLNLEKFHKISTFWPKNVSFEFWWVRVICEKNKY